jgi:hypothetical protein
LSFAFFFFFGLLCTDEHEARWWKLADAISLVPEDGHSYWILSKIF